MNTAIHITGESRAEFRNQVQYCIGTGRMDLALMQEYQQELKEVQALCGFRHIRGHGLFCRQMGIYQQVKDPDGAIHISYNFTYLDRVMDMYLANGLEPFIELGFMPEDMAGGTQTVFWWQGNVTPPKEDRLWTDMVQATLRHLMERYGAERAVTWPVEVWNEPNLTNFWENRDKEKYLHLYDITARAVKAVSPSFRVGGPAICGGGDSLEWVRDFLAFCRDNRLPVDFLTRHAYMGNTPEHRGRYLYHTMCTAQEAMQPLRDTRAIIDSFPEYAGMEMHVTEFNTSYNPLCPIHDTNANAAIIAHWLSLLGETSASYSYWTFGDVFEEGGVPAAPFHGGFGLMAGGCIPKPTLWSFAFFSRLKGEGVYRDDHAVITREADGSLAGVLWNDGEEDLAVSLRADDITAGVLETSTVDPETTNPLKCWHEMGEPASLTAGQLAFLRDAGRPLNRTCRVAEGQAAEIAVRRNGVVFFRLRNQPINPDYGYDYSWYADRLG